MSDVLARARRAAYGEYERRLRRAGFDVSVERFAVEIGEELAHRYRLRDQEDIYLCAKPSG